MIEEEDEELISRKKKESPEEFRLDMIETYGQDTWEVMRNFILNGSEAVSVGEEIEENRKPTILAEEELLAVLDVIVIDDDSDKAESSDILDIGDDFIVPLDLYEQSDDETSGQGTMVNTMIDHLLGDPNSIEAF